MDMPDPDASPDDVRNGCLLILFLGLVCVLIWALILWSFWP